MQLCAVAHTLAAVPAYDMQMSVAAFVACRRLSVTLALVLGLLLAGCGGVWNDPYPVSERGQSILYTAFTERPKHLDPVQSYAEDEAAFLYQIYEPPLAYHYLHRPYRLVAQSTALPEVTLLDADGNTLPPDADPARIARSRYVLRLTPGIRYQPHPAFAQDASGAPRYLGLSADDLRGKRGIADFPETGTRALTADDFAYQIRRLAHPALHSPIFELIAGYLPGLATLKAELDAAWAARPASARDQWFDLRPFALPGVEVLDAHTLAITLEGHYPQFRYWLTMPFFAPVPFEAERFFAQPGMAERNLSLDRWPVGTGPYMLVENDPNARMVLAANPNYRGDTYPCEGEPGDAAAGLLADCGKPLPMIARVVFTRERENIPHWNKFLQGYYDASGVSSDNFDQAVNMSVQGDVTLSDEMRARGIRLSTSVSASVFYLGFNQLDDVVGDAVRDGVVDAAQAERNRRLRQAVSIVLDMESFVAIFLNGRGVPAMSPIPPGIFGARTGADGVNPVVYRRADDGAERFVRRSLDEARALLAEAGWPGGRHAETGEPLILNLDTTPGGFGDKARSDWLTRQFREIGVQFVVRATDWNRFQEKVRDGNVQLFFMGWNADYPDPENLLFLLHGEQAKVGQSGQNAANYRNPAYDALFERMRLMPDGPARQAVIDRMVTMLQHDAPWVFGFHPKSYVLSHAWLHNRKPGDMVRGTLKYQRLDVPARAAARAEWNPPQRWPLVLAAGLAVLVLLPALVGWRRRERATARREGV